MKKNNSQGYENEIGLFLIFALGYILWHIMKVVY